MPIIKYVNNDIPSEFFLTDSVGFDDIVFLYPEIIVDSVGFNDTIVINSSTQDFLLDSVGLNDILTNIVNYYNTVDSNVFFNDFLGTRDILLTWGAVTNTPRYGYGGTAYGDVLGYGESFCSDLEYFIINIKNCIDAIVRTEEISVDITDPMPGPNSYWYDSAMNIADNGSMNFSLTFDLYQKNNLGLVSEASSVNHLELPVVTDGLLSFWSCDSVIGTTLYDDYGTNNLTLGTGITEGYFGKYKGLICSAGGITGVRNTVISSTSGFTFIVFAYINIGTLPSNFRFLNMAAGGYNWLEFGNYFNDNKIYTRLNYYTLSIVGGYLQGQTAMYAWSISNTGYISTVYRNKTILDQRATGQIPAYQERTGNLLSNFSGKMGECIIYNRCLTDQEIFNIYDQFDFYLGG